MKGQTYRGGILTREGVMAWCDEDDFDKLNRYNWSLNDEGYVRQCSLPRILMHRMVLGLGKHVPLVDHINRNKVDNQKSNLRTVDRFQNQWNRVAKKGVEYSERYRLRWCGYIFNNGKRIRTRRYATAREAKIAREELAKQLKGEYYPRREY